MENLIYKFFEFGYVLIFGILGVFTLLTKVPEHEGMRSYKKACTTLGCGLIVIAIYCLTRLVFPETHEGYNDFWLLVTFTLIHSWLLYSALLFLMESPRFRIKHFLVDGVIPTSLMLITGTVGSFIPSIQSELFVIFGVIYGVKCAWMFRTCIQEYRLCQKDVENYYDQKIGIKWIGQLIWISLFMSAATVISFYLPSTRLIYYLLIPIIYVYIVMKFMNFMPLKIDKIRHSNTKMEEKPVEEKSERVKDLVDKIGPMVDRWVEEKRFCRADLNIKDVAAEIGTNQNYLSQYLNRYKGVTFQVWLNMLRIEESKLILISGEKISIEEVGVKVGIPQAYNFSRWFKVVTNTTPYQFRKLNG